MTKSLILETPDIGLSDKNRDGVVDTLRVVLADAHVLYIKLRKYHWNVTGPQFFSLHELFEQQYTALASSIDEIAERIVQYGAFAPGTLEEFKATARLEETPGKVPEARTMVEDIVNDHEAAVRHLREDIETVGKKYGDVGAEDFLIALLQAHQQQAWMARIPEW